MILNFFTLGKDTRLSFSRWPFHVIQMLGKHSHRPQGCSACYSTPIWERPHKVRCLKLVHMVHHLSLHAKHGQFASIEITSFSCDSCQWRWPITNWHSTWKYLSSCEAIGCVLMCILTFQCISQNMMDWAWSRWPKRCWPKVYLLTLNLLSDLSCHQALWKISQNNRWSVASSTSNPTIATLATASAWAVVSEMSRKRLEESFRLLAIEVGISGTKENRG